MKSKKLNLDQLRIKSFVTDVDKNGVKLTIKGGVTTWDKDDDEFNSDASNCVCVPETVGLCGSVSCYPCQ